MEALLEIEPAGLLSRAFVAEATTAFEQLIDFRFSDAIKAAVVTAFETGRSPLSIDQPEAAVYLSTLCSSAQAGEDASLSGAAAGGALVMGLQR